MKPKKTLITLLILLITIIPFSTSTQPTQQYNKIYLNPFYRNTLTSNTNYTYTLNINPPDGITEIKSAIINYDTYLTPTITFNLWVNGRTCNNSQFNVSTTYAGSGQGRITFDCTNIINQTGTYNLTLRPTQANTGATTGWLDLTYMNKPLADLTLHGTEYSYGQTSKAWLQLTNASDTTQTIENGICFVDIYTPNQTEFVERAMMNNMNHDGIYYYDIILPENPGVYPVIANCFYTATTTPNYATNLTMINGSIGSGTITNTYLADGTYYNSDETPPISGNPRRYESIMSFKNGSICSNIPASLLNGISINWVGRWNSIPTTDYMTIEIYNHTNASWTTLPNTITGVGTGSKSVSNSLQFNNITSAGYTNTTGSDLRLRFKDTNESDTSSSGFDFDYLSVDCLTYSNPNWQQVAGSSEFHLSPDIIANLTPTLENITNITATNQNWLTQIWNYLVNTLNFKIDLLLNQSNITTEAITITTTDNAPCITGSTWEITATTTGHFQQLLTNTEANCTINTTTWGTENMTYTGIGTWTYTNTCPTPSNWTWQITCI